MGFSMTERIVRLFYGDFLHMLGYVGIEFWDEMWCMVSIQHRIIDGVIFFSD